MLSVPQAKIELLVRNRLLKSSLWIFLVLLLLSIYGKWLVDATPETLRLTWWIFGPFLLFTDFLNPVFFDRVWFFLFCICGLTICVLFWFTGRGQWMVRAISASASGIIVAAPVAVMIMYGPYSLRTVRVANGYELSWLTQPQGRFASAFKTAQREHDVSGCKYLLKGWSLDNRIYYGSNCGTGLWMYDPKTGEKPRRLQHLPVDSESLTAVRVTGNSRPSGQDGLSATLVAETSLSPDGRSLAAVIQDSFYGPFDLIVMHRSFPN